MLFAQPVKDKLKIAFLVPIIPETYPKIASVKTPSINIILMFPAKVNNFSLLLKYY